MNRSLSDRRTMKISVAVDCLASKTLAALAM
jgi:hypothetical protein